MKLKLALIVICINCAVCLLAGGIVYSLFSLGGCIRHKKMEARAEADRKADAGRNVVDLKLDKKTLMDREKTFAAAKIIKESYSKVKTGNPQIYTSLPEGEFFRSFYAFYFLSHQLGSKEVMLDPEWIDEFRQKGRLIYSMDRRYPFMKKSIYLDPSRKSYNKPAIRVGTNIVIVFVESLSSFFLKEEIHGVKGLMPNIRGMGQESFSFTDMYNTSYPTLKGLIAALGSAIYLLDEEVGGTRIPVPCRFLFLSNILKKLDYTTIHIQAGSERFIGMKNLFMEREGYDYFYGSESLALDNISRLERGFGVDDEKVFDYTIEWLEKYKSGKPFLLTISTINSHPPYKGSYKHPGSGGNPMLDGLYSTDKAFGKFWEFFKKSRFSGNTVVILTADHAMGNSNEYTAFVRNFEEHYKPFFDNIPCFIHFPGGPWNSVRNDTPCVSLDLTPTILDMMNLDLANPFMGLSIFSERSYYKRENADLSMKFDAQQYEKAKKILGFYLNTYREDRILPRDFKVQLY
ncbi:MAG TPA: LTA synthase family protein [Spirochaetota bacterium]|nr:LTA synthase family protein [Spirochaetota bacterium]